MLNCNDSFVIDVYLTWRMLFLIMQPKIQMDLSNGDKLIDLCELEVGHQLKLLPNHQSAKNGICYKE